MTQEIGQLVEREESVHGCSENNVSIDVLCDETAVGQPFGRNSPALPVRSDQLLLRGGEDKLIGFTRFRVHRVQEVQTELVNL